jgi:osmoprotectant transport system substrate-binding protein
MRATRVTARRAAALLAALLLTAAVLGGCGSGSRDPTGSQTGTTTLPGEGRPSVTIGDKNFPEQFVLGQLYDQALTARGYSVVLDPNIGPTQVTTQALVSGRLDMYPEYVDVWNTFVAGYQHGFASARSAYQAASTYAHAHGLALLRPTPFSDTNALAVTTAYAKSHALESLGDLQRVAAGLTVGAPTQFQDSSVGLVAAEHAYAFTPAAVSTLDIGAQYQALTQSAVQAAYMTTTDGELAGTTFTMLADPLRVFGWGNVMPVVRAAVLAAEGPDFAATINRVSALLTLPVMRRLNAAVELAQQDPALVAHQFLAEHGLVPPGSSP